MAFSTFLFLEGICNMGALGSLFGFGNSIFWSNLPDRNDRNYAITITLGPTHNTSCRFVAAITLHFDPIIGWNKYINHPIWNGRSHSNPVLGTSRSPLGSLIPPKPRCVNRIHLIMKPIHKIAPALVPLVFLNRLLGQILIPTHPEYEYSLVGIIPNSNSNSNNYY